MRRALAADTGRAASDIARRLQLSAQIPEHSCRRVEAVKTVD